MVGGFGLLVLLGLIAAVIGVGLMTESRSEVTRSAVLSANALRNMDVSRDVEVMRRAALRFSVSAEPAAKTEFTEAGVGVIGKLEQQIEMAVSPARKAAYANIKAGVEKYRTDFIALTASPRSRQETNRRSSRSA
ncbi:MAG: hypothetical protein WDO24_01245 [Pseudomonadota bacterium]